MMNYINIASEFFNKIPDTYKPAVLTSAATLIGAFLGAGIAQYISHRLTLKRENQKYYKESYQKLFAPVLLDVYAYCDIYTHFRRGHDIKLGVNEELILEKIIHHIENNLMYARPNLISCFNTVKRNEYEDDMSGFNYRINEIKLLEVFLDELRNVANKGEIFDKNSNRIVIQHLIYYRIWCILSRYYSNPDLAARTLSNKFYFNRSKLTLRNYKKIKKNYTYDTFKNKIFSWFSQKSQAKYTRSKFLLKIYLKLFDYLFKDHSYFYRMNNFELMYRLFINNSVIRQQVIEVTENNKDIQYEYNNQHNVSPIAEGLFFLNLSCSFGNDDISYLIEARNTEKMILNISINDFKLIKYGSKRVNVTVSQSGFWNGLSFEDNDYVLYPDESINFKILFQKFDNNNREEFILNYILNNKTYLIHKCHHTT